MNVHPGQLVLFKEYAVFTFHLHEESLCLQSDAGNASRKK